MARSTWLCVATCRCRPCLASSSCCWVMRASSVGLVKRRRLESLSTVCGSGVRRASNWFASSESCLFSSSGAMVPA